MKLVKPAERSPLSQVFGDANAMGLWVFLSAVNEELGAILSSALGIPPMVAGLTVLCTGLALYEPICEIVGGKGASFNPSQNFAFAAAGKGAITLHALRSLAQAVGGVVGAGAALKMVPRPWQAKFGNYAHGVSPGASLLQGFCAEALLSFLLNIVILWAMETRHKRLAKLAPYIATVILIPAGAGYSGPFMNPAFAFSWFFHLKGAAMWEHISVFWGGCLLGSYLAGLAWFYLVSPPLKAKTAAKRGAPKARVAVNAGEVDVKKTS